MTCWPSETKFPSVDVHDLDVGVTTTAEETEFAAEVVSLARFTNEDDMLQSKLIATDVMDNYKRAAVKLKKDLTAMDFSDHIWKLKSYDLNGSAVVRIHCEHCNKDVGGTSSDHSRSSIQNLFANFKKSHLHSALHIRHWCKSHNILYSDHPRKEGNPSKPLLLTSTDHKRLVEEGVSILQSVNDSISSDDPPFVLIGDVGSEQLKCAWYKVRCKLDGETMLLCPAKQNLRINLDHVNGLTHTKCVQDLAAAANSTSRKSGICTGKRGRPSTRSTSNIGKQPDLHTWFSRSSSRDSRAGDDSALGMKSNSILSLLCWGYWNKITKYAGKVYQIDALLNDPKSGALWSAEPNTSAEFIYKNKKVVVTGCFRHVHCKRLTFTGTPYTNFSYDKCSELVLARDFRFRVLREGCALVKRGLRGTECGRRVDYLSSTELAAHSRQLAKKFRHEKAMKWVLKARVAQLKVKQWGLKLSALENFNREDVLSFCNNILAAHRTNAFGGKPTLWDFLWDVAKNLNRVRQGHRFSPNAKSFGQAMKIYGGRRMCDLFSLNFGGPSYDTIKRQNKKGVQFIAGEHSSLFIAVAQIYEEAKTAHGVFGTVPIILAKDETKMKSRISWEARSDGLVGFCGHTHEHVCVSTFRPQVGNGESGYSAIVDAFRQNQKGSFARVIMVNPLHEKLSKLVLVVSCTCNCFDSKWVRNQWKRIDSLWQERCATSVGPIIGHASDGDSRRRQLMVKDFTAR